MTSDLSGNQRRSPRQARSRATFEAIVEAASQILERDGAGAFNTNAVAERAGVSIGTLYQYFPDKQAILLAAARREPLPSRHRALVDALIAAIEAVSRLGGAAAAQSVTVRRTPARQPRRRPTAWERSFRDAVDELLAALSPAPEMKLIPIPIRVRRR
ncbi:MAG TPA: helix-turn-helix domain-containing protein [Caulobacteraceae bacterium]|jgi:AcrR family transcriptional regulator